MTLTKEVVEFANVLQIQDDIHLQELIEESIEIGEKIEAGDDSLRSVLDVLVTTIESYEDDHFKLPSVSPEEMMRWLMEKNSHKQTDMIDVASRTVINEILKGKRKLNRLHIERLCIKYNVDANWFYHKSIQEDV